MSILLHLAPPVKVEQRNVHMAAGSTNSADTLDIQAHPEDRSHQTQPITYPSCFGLPYQDHNYAGAPPPPTPPQSPPPAPKINGQIHIEEPIVVSVSTSEQPANGGTEDMDDSITRCICDFQHDDGYMICCDKCSVWQHIDCMEIDRANIPDAYFCELCEPRKVNKQKAVELQTHRRELLIDSSSSTDTDVETGFHHNGTPTVNSTSPVNSLLSTKKNLKGKKQKKKEQEKNEKKAKKEKVKKEKKEKVQGLIKECKTINNVKEKKQIREVNKKVKTTRPALGSVIVNEDARDPWANNPCDTYEEAKCSVYSSEVQNLLVSKFNSQNIANSVDFKPSLNQLPAQLCQLAQVSPLRKGLEATDDIGYNIMILEFIGKVMLKEQFDKENVFFKRNHPFVLFYSKLDGVDICVDASCYGNEGRYLRRSCLPNSEVRHFVENANLHFYIYSTKSISKGAEITIPFDFDYKECNYGVECACARASCPVKRFNNRKLDNSSIPKPVSKRRRSTKSVEQKEITESTNKKHPKSPLRVSIDAVKPEEPVIPVVAPPSSGMISPKTPVKQEESSQPILSVESPGDQTLENVEAESERRKKMTREERKMEAIMKAFEKLEKREERRKEALARLELIKKPKEGDVKEETEPQEEIPVKEEINKTETIKVEKPKPARKKSKRHGTPARRRSRYNSSGPTSAGLSDSGHSQDESSNTGCTTTPVSSVPQTPQPDSALPLSPAAGNNNMFRFPKTKKHMMTEWLTEKSSTPDLNKPLSIKTEPPDVSTMKNDFVRCLPSPHTSSLTHLRRSSSSGSNNSNHTLSKASAQNLDTSMGSAKKRWLRQAMFESNNPNQPMSGGMSPIHLGGMSPIPNSCSNSPGASPQAVDFVTPLKKRRLARESISMDNPFPPTPSTPMMQHNSEDSMDVDEYDLGNPRSQNGFQAHMLPITPITPSDNLFDRFGVTSGSNVSKQESLESDISDYLLNRSRENNHNDESAVSMDDEDSQLSARERSSSQDSLNSSHLVNITGKVIVHPGRNYMDIAAFSAATVVRAEAGAAATTQQRMEESAANQTSSSMQTESSVESVTQRLSSSTIDSPQKSLLSTSSDSMGKEESTSGIHPQAVLSDSQQLRVDAAPSFRESKSHYADSCEAETSDKSVGSSENCSQSNVLERHAVSATSSGGVDSSTVCHSASSSTQHHHTGSSNNNNRQTDTDSDMKDDASPGLSSTSTPTSTSSFSSSATPLLSVQTAATHTPSHTDTPCTSSMHADHRLPADSVVVGTAGTETRPLTATIHSVCDSMHDNATNRTLLPCSRSSPVVSSNCTSTVLSSTSASPPKTNNCVSSIILSSNLNSSQSSEALRVDDTRDNEVVSGEVTHACHSESTDQKEEAVNVVTSNVTDSPVSCQQSDMEAHSVNREVNGTCEPSCSYDTIRRTELLAVPESLLPMDEAVGNRLADRDDINRHAIENRPADSVHSDAQAVADSVNSEHQAVSDGVNSDAQAVAVCVHSDTQPAADSVHSDVQPAADSIHSAVQPAADSLHSDVQPAADSVHSDVQPAADSVHSAVQPAADSVHSDVQPAADSVHSDTQAVPVSCSQPGGSDEEEPVSSVKTEDDTQNQVEDMAEHEAVAAVTESSASEPVVCCSKSADRTEPVSSVQQSAGDEGDGVSSDQQEVVDDCRMSSDHHNSADESSVSSRHQQQQHRVDGSGLSSGQRDTVDDSGATSTTVCTAPAASFSEVNVGSSHDSSLEEGEIVDDTEEEEEAMEASSSQNLFVSEASRNSSNHYCHSAVVESSSSAHRRAARSAVEEGCVQSSEEKLSISSTMCSSGTGGRRCDSMHSAVCADNSDAANAGVAVTEEDAVVDTSTARPSQLSDNPLPSTSEQFSSKMDALVDSTTNVTLVQSAGGDYECTSEASDVSSTCLQGEAEFVSDTAGGQVSSSVINDSSLVNTNLSENSSSSLGVCSSASDVQYNADWMCGYLTVTSSDRSAALTTSPAISSSVQPPGTPPVKKKVSLLEYRRRMKQKGGEKSSSRSSTPTSSASRSNTMMVSSNSRDSAPTLAPLPLFESSSPQDSECGTSRDSSSSKQEKDGKRNEKPLSLTERLRREFGLDATDDEEDADSEAAERIPPPPGPVVYQHPVSVLTTTSGHPHHPAVVTPQPSYPVQPPALHPPPQVRLHPASLPTAVTQGAPRGAAGTGGSIPPLMSLPTYPTKAFQCQGPGPAQVVQNSMRPTLTRTQLPSQTQPAPSVRFPLPAQHPTPQPSVQNYTHPLPPPPPPPRPTPAAQPQPYQQVAPQTHTTASYSNDSQYGHRSLPSVPPPPPPPLPPPPPPPPSRPAVQTTYNGPHTGAYSALQHHPRSQQNYAQYQNSTATAAAAATPQLSPPQPQSASTSHSLPHTTPNSPMTLAQYPPSQPFTTHQQKQASSGLQNKQSQQVFPHGRGGYAQHYSQAGPSAYFQK